MIDNIRTIIKNVLEAIYQPFLFALVLSIFVMFFIMYLEKYNSVSIKNKLIMSLKEWKNTFFGSLKFRRMFYLVFFVIMVLFKTLMNRDIWVLPFKDVLGVWGFTDYNGKYTTEIIENTVLFIPVIIFLFLFLETTSKKDNKFLPIMGKTILFSFLFSLSIEMLQLFLRLGTWQLSDLCFNTLGGLIGGLIYWVSLKIRKV